jgi:excisionase family DNA binding protein
VSTLLHDHVLTPDPAEHERLEQLRDAVEEIAVEANPAGEPAPPAKLVSPDGVEVEIPASAFTALQAVVRDMARGLTMTLIPHDRDLTTKEAADILSVSRPFLVKMLDSGEIPFHRVGSHRRVNVEDVLAYRERRAARRREHLAELTRLSEEIEGGYR